MIKRSYRLENYWGTGSRRQRMTKARRHMAAKLTASFSNQETRRRCSVSQSSRPDGSLPERTKAPMHSGPPAAAAPAAAPEPAAGE